MSKRLIAGAMSGTSADGVDVAIVEIDGRGPDMTARLIRHVHEPYRPDLRRQIFAIREGGAAELRKLAQLAAQISQTYARTVRKALAASALAPSDIVAVAAHGQTLFHEPPYTIQWIDPSLLAAQTGCAVVSDFRRADCALGGQGAPLVPFADYVLFRDPTVDRALVNIGGIANVTLLRAGASIDQLIAFDTGPGNCISDYLMRTDDPGGVGVDVDGRLAAAGSVIQPLLEAALNHPFFKRLGPKSTDGPGMVRIYLDALATLNREQSREDQLATACAITARGIVGSIGAFEMQPTEQVIVSGGGTRNRTLMDMLRREFANTPVRTSDEFGVPTEAKEAIAFALLGAATLDGLPSNVPSCTGARRPVTLGSITPRP